MIVFFIFLPSFCGTLIRSFVQKILYTEYRPFFCRACFSFIVELNIFCSFVHLWTYVYLFLDRWFCQLPVFLAGASIDRCSVGRSVNHRFCQRARACLPDHDSIVHHRHLLIGKYIFLHIFYRAAAASISFLFSVILKIVIPSSIYLSSCCCARAASCSAHGCIFASRFSIHLFAIAWSDRWRTLMMMGGDKQRFLYMYIFSNIFYHHLHLLMISFTLQIIRDISF